MGRFLTIDTSIFLSGFLLQTFLWLYGGGGGGRALIVSRGYSLLRLRFHHTVVMPIDPGVAADVSPLTSCQIREIRADSRPLLRWRRFCRTPKPRGYYYGA